MRPPVLVSADGTSADLLDSLLRGEMSTRQLVVDTGRTYNAVYLSLRRLDESGYVTQRVVARPHGRTSYWTITDAGRAVLASVMAHPDRPAWLGRESGARDLLDTLARSATGTLPTPELMDDTGRCRPSCATALYRLRSAGYVTREYLRHAGGRLALWTITDAGRRALALVAA